MGAVYVRMKSLKGASGREGRFKKLQFNLFVWMVCVVVVFWVLFSVMTYFLVSDVFYTESIERTEKFMHMSIRDVEQKLKRTDRLVDEAINKYMYLKASPNESPYYDVNYLLSNICSSYYVTTKYDLQTFVYYDGRVENDSFAQPNRQNIADFITEEYERVQGQIAQGFCFFCVQNDIVCLKALPIEREDFLIGVVIPSRLFMNPFYQSNNIFLKSLNVYLSVDSKSAPVWIDTGGGEFFSVEKIQTYIDQSAGVYRQSWNTVAVKENFEDGFILALQDLSFLRGIHYRLILRLAAIFSVVVIICAIMLRKLLHNVIYPMDALYQQMEEYGQAGKGDAGND